jgi:hypothetical protein
MEIKLISKSGKDRQGHTYTRDNHGEPYTRLDKSPRPWKQIVIHEVVRNPLKPGKMAIHSRTKHVPL